MLITFEGIDGSGKSTQIGLLKKHLEEAGYKVVVLREPGGTEASEVIRGLLLNPEIAIDPLTELLLFSAARSQVIAEKVKPALAAGNVVILDRFYDSTVSYQGYARSAAPMETIHTLNKIASHEIVPDITFYLKLDVDIAWQRREARSGVGDRMEREGKRFQQKVAEGFDALAQSESRFCTINAALTPGEMSQLIWHQVVSRLQKQG